MKKWLKITAVDKKLARDPKVKKFLALTAELIMREEDALLAAMRDAICGQPTCIDPMPLSVSRATFKEMQAKGVSKMWGYELAAYKAVGPYVVKRGRRTH